MLLFFFVTLIGAVATYAYLLNQRGVVNEPDFVFTWGSDEQNIVEGTFRLDLAYSGRGKPNPENQN